MPLFMCSRCGVVENTALSEFWSQRMRAHEAKEEFKPQCSECHGGTWHGQFPRTPATGFVKDKSGHIYKPEEAQGYYKHMGPFEPVTLPPHL